MNCDDYIGMQDVKVRLNTLAKILPGRDPRVYDFGVHIAETLRDVHNPSGFCLAVEGALEGIMRGKNPLTGQDVSSLMQGCVESRMILRKHIPEIVDAVCPPYFVGEVREIYRYIN